MVKRMVVGNWKMNTNLAEGIELVQAIANALPALGRRGEVVVAPPYPYLAAILAALQGSTVKVAAQNMCWEGHGAFTGEVSPTMLKDLGIAYVILGHSERRQIFKETDALINQKILAALGVGLAPILCVGESLAEREAGGLQRVLVEQLRAGLQGVADGMIGDLVIAYEPVWAIGTGKTATPEEAAAAHSLIRQWLVEHYGAEIALKISLLYGGSVKGSNSRSLLSQPNVDGALVGGASLKASEFLSIIEQL